MSSVQVSIVLFEFIHSLNNFPEPDAAYGAWERCASGGLCSPLWREVGPETVTYVVVCVGCESATHYNGIPERRRTTMLQG